MTAEIVERVRRSSRYREVDEGLVSRLAAEELPKSRTTDEAVKRVKRRLHQAVGAFRTRAASVREWPVHDASALRDACADAMRRHASTRERLPYLDRFYAGIWEHTQVPGRLLDLGCGLDPLALPWMRIGSAHYTAVDADTGTLATAAGFLVAVGHPHRALAHDLVLGAPEGRADVALMLKLVTTLDRQDGQAADRLLASLDARHAVVSFAARSLAGRGGRESTYRRRLDLLAERSGRVTSVVEASVPNELVFVLTLEPLHG